ncbi:MAG: flagellar motor protein MotB [Gemmatimonadota bacterium]
MNKDREIPVRIIIRKKKVHGGHHGGAWKVALADFMTSMFALFLVLWLVNQSVDVKQAIAGYFQDPLGNGPQNGSSILPGSGVQNSSPKLIGRGTLVDMPRQRLVRLSEKLLKDLKADSALAGLSDNVEVTMTSEGLRIELVEDSAETFFSSGNASPTDHGGGVLALLGRELKELPNPVVIDGYTDSRPYGRSGLYGNWDLSADRANAARRILTANGLLDSRVTQVRGWADRQLKLPDDPLSPRNRRVTITVQFQQVGTYAATRSDTSTSSVPHE